MLTYTSASFKPFDSVRLLFSAFMLATLSWILILPGHSSAQRIAEDILPPSLEQKEDIEVMVMGTYHFDNPNRDEYNIDAADVKSPERQRQVKRVVKKLAKFKPDKVALEYVRKDSATFDSLYQAYRQGKHELRRNEREQLGYRLADSMGHKHVYAVDWNNAFPIDKVKAHAREHDKDFLTYLNHWGPTIKSRQDSIEQHGGVYEALRHINSPYFEDAQRQMYAKTATVGNDTNYPGVELVKYWNERNMRIFANMEDIANPGDRIFIMFGAGHSYILRDLVEAHPQMELVHPLDYL